MKIAVLSGKGGTGKTFVSVNLAQTAESALYLDCDVEEPNGHLFLRPEGVQRQVVTKLLPAFAAENARAVGGVWTSAASMRWPISREPDGVQGCLPFLRRLCAGLSGGGCARGAGGDRPH